MLLALNIIPYLAIIYALNTMSGTRTLIHQMWVLQSTIKIYSNKLKIIQYYFYFRILFIVKEI